MLKKILDIYDKNINLIRTFVEEIYHLSMIVVIFLGHNVDGFVSTRSYKLFIAIFMAFGIWSFEIKNSSIKRMSLDIFTKFVTITLSSIIIAKLTGDMNLSNLYNVFYPLYTIILYSILNKKSMWEKKYKLSSSDYLKLKFGRTISVVPSIILFFAIIIPGFINASTKMFVSSLLIGFTIEHIFVFSVLKSQSY